MDCITSGLSVYHQLLEFTQIHVHGVSDAMQPSHTLSSPSPHAFNHSHHQGLFFFLFFKFYFILLYNTVLVLPYISMNLSWVYMRSQSWSPPPHPSPYHLSGSSQCTSPKHPVSCIEPILAIHFLYDIIHVSMPFSQITPPSPSRTEFIRLLYTSVSLLLSRIQGYHYHLYKFHIYVLVYCIGVFPFFLTSLCITGSSFIHLIRTHSNAFFVMAE